VLAAGRRAFKKKRRCSFNDGVNVKWSKKRRESRIIMSHEDYDGVCVCVCLYITSFDVFYEQQLVVF